MMTRFLAFLLLAAQAFGVQYYVRTDGNDANAGTANTSGGAWLTLGKANTMAQPGDTINVGEGVFLQATVATLRNGTAAAPIVWQGASKESTIIRTTAQTGGGSLPYAFSVRHDYIYIRDMRLEEASVQVTVGSDYGRLERVVFEQPKFTHLRFEDNGKDGSEQLQWVVRNCEFREMGNSFRGIVGNVACIVVNGTGHLFEANYLTSTIGSGAGNSDVFHIWGINHVIRGNTLENWSRQPDSLAHVDFLQTFTASQGPLATSEGHIIENNFLRNADYMQIGNIEDQLKTGKVRNWVWRNNIFHRVSNQINLYCTGFRWHNNTFSYAYIAGFNLQFKYGPNKAPRITSAEVYNNIWYKCGNPQSAEQGWFIHTKSNDARKELQNAAEVAGTPLTAYTTWESLGIYLDGLASPPTTTYRTLGISADGATGIVADHNLVVGVGAGRVKLAISDPGYIGTTKWDLSWRRWGNANGLNGVDPLFVGAVRIDDPDGVVTPDDFRPLPGSPLIGAGIPLNGEFTTDFAGTVRGATWDIGAFQYAAGALPTDTTRPTLTGASIDASGTQLTLTYSENVLNVNGAHYTLSTGQALEVVSQSGTTATFSITPAAAAGTSVTLGYIGGAGRTVDAANNQLASFSGVAVVNGSLEQPAQQKRPGANRKGGSVRRR